MDSTALVRSGNDHHDHHDGDSDHHDRQVVYVHNHHINNDIDVTFEGNNDLIYHGSNVMTNMYQK